jgi:hypothetical protein
MYFRARQSGRRPNQRAQPLGFADGRRGELLRSQRINYWLGPWGWLGFGMVRFVANVWLPVALGFLVVTAADAADYEPTSPPRILAVTADARSFYLEFRARNEVGGFGHSYVTLGSIDASGQEHQTVVVGFMPKSADDDYWSKFGLPVVGLVGVSRSDFSQRPDARFRILLSRATYFRVVSEIRGLRKTWTQYELVVHNCNSFANEIASSVGLRTPLITAQYPVSYVAGLRALNPRPIRGH